MNSVTDEWPGPLPERNTSPGELVQEAMRAARAGSHEFLLAMEDILETEAWRSFPHVSGHRTVQHATLRSFIESEQFDGLGLNAGAVTALLKKSNAVEAARRMQQILDEEFAAAQPAGSGRIPNKMMGDTHLIAPQDHRDRASFIARLKRDNPNLAEAVIAGQLSANAAAIEAGFRKKRVSVVVDDARLAIKALLKHYTSDELLAALSDS